MFPQAGGFLRVDAAGCDPARSGFVNTAEQGFWIERMCDILGVAGGGADGEVGAMVDLDVSLPDDARDALDRLLAVLPGGLDGLLGLAGAALDAALTEDPAATVGADLTTLAGRVESLARTVEALRVRVLPVVDGAWLWALDGQRSFAT